MLKKQNITHPKAAKLATLLEHSSKTYSSSNLENIDDTVIGLQFFGSVVSHPAF